MSDPTSDEDSSLGDTLEASPTEPRLLKLNCRVCYRPPNKVRGCMIPVRSPCGNGEPSGEPQINIRKALLFCVPKMTVRYKDHICRKCLRNLETTYSFIKTCLETESRIAALKDKGSVNNVSQSLQENERVGDKSLVHITKKVKNEPKDDCVESTTPKPVKNQPIKKEPKPLSDEDDDSQVSIYDKPDIIDYETLAETINENNLDEDSNITKKLPDGILELFDFSSKNSRCLVVKRNLTEEESKDLVDYGINVIHMSTNPNKRKRVVYVGRDMEECIKQCQHCSLRFFFEADLDDHLLAHKKGTVKLDENVVKTEIRKCPMCPAEFMAQADLNVHSEQVHNVEKPFVCPQCNKRFRSQNLLNCHARFTVEGEQRCQLQCPKCNKEFKQTSEYETHVAISETSSTCDIVKCKTCGEFMARLILKEHLQTHQENNSALCPQCGKFLPDTGTLTRHILLCHTKRDEKFLCPKCAKLFTHKSNYTRHLQAVHGDKLHSCDQCSRKFTHSCYLKKHIARHHKVVEESEFSCDKCGAMLKSSVSLRLHIRNIHEGIREYSCDLCGERFARSANLARHKKYHDRYKYACEICQTSFREEIYLKIHMETGHDEKGRPLKASRNGSKSHIEWHLKALIEAGHDEEGRPLKTRNIDSNKLTEFKIVNGKKVKLAKHQMPKACPVCQKVLSNSQRLRVHYRTHLKFLQKKCPKCDCYFSTNGNLRRHFKKHDDANYELRCRICHTDQKSESHLKIHMETIHKNRKYKCHICHEAFGRKHILSNHVLKQHPEESEERRQEMDVLVNEELEDIPVEDEEQFNYSNSVTSNEAQYNSNREEEVLEEEEEMQEEEVDNLFDEDYDLSE